MTKGHSEIMEDNLFFLEKQVIVVDNFDASGPILDIGGGGEGVIGQMKGDQVVAIDPNRRELEEAADGPLKIVMNAGDLLFLDHAFDVVTSFFTLMYISGSEHEKIFEEVYRVLAPGGRFLVWDVDLPPRLDETKGIVAFYLTIKLPSKEITTGYGTRWPEQERGLSHFTGIAERVGFVVSEWKESGRIFFLALQKP